MFQSPSSCSPTPIIHCMIMTRDNKQKQQKQIFISINLQVFNHECRSLIGYATRYLFCDR